MPERNGLEEGPLITLDSGESNPVAHPDQFPGAVVTPSEASRRGVVYQGPGSETIPNLGEFFERLMTAEGVVAETVWQAAQVRKPLMAVSACADRGNMVVFDSAGSCILSGNSPEIRQIRELIRAATKKVRVQRNGGTYNFRMWRLPRSPVKSKDFHGQGK